MIAGVARHLVLGDRHQAAGRDRPAAQPRVAADPRHHRVEDIFLALYLAILQPVLGDASGPVEVAIDLGKAFGFLIVLAALARWGARVGRPAACASATTSCWSSSSSGWRSSRGRRGGAGRLGRDRRVHDRSGARRLDRRATACGRWCARCGTASRAIFFFAFGLTIDPGDIGRGPGAVAGRGGAHRRTQRRRRGARRASARLRAAGGGQHRPDRAHPRGVLADPGSLAVAAGLDPRIAPFVAGYVLVLAVIGPLAVTPVREARCAPSQGTSRQLR